MSLVLGDCERGWEGGGGIVAIVSMGDRVSCLLWLLGGGDLGGLQAVVMFWERSTVLGGLQEVRRLRLGSNGGVVFLPRSL
jgi:hypothetical protein